MSELIETLTSLLGPTGPLLALGAAGLLMVTLKLPFILVKKKDPFDRMIVAQATTEGLRLISHDDIVRQYPLDVEW